MAVRRRCRILPRDGPVRARARYRYLFVHAHPDDETLWTGGTMAACAARPDATVSLVTCTLGEQGDVLPAQLALLAPGEADQLGGYRAGELARACAVLGVTDHRSLGGAGRWRDSGMVPAGRGVRAAAPRELHPRAFVAVNAVDEQVAALVAVLEELAPQVVVTYGADGGYGHPDHVRAHRVTVAALDRVAARSPSPPRLLFTAIGRSTLDAAIARLAALPGLPFRLPGPDDLPSVPDATVTSRVDVRAHRWRRLAALRAHATQIALWAPTPDVGGAGGGAAFALSNGVAQPLLDTEEYVAADGAPAPDPFTAAVPG